MNNERGKGKPYLHYCQDRLHKGTKTIIYLKMYLSYLLKGNFMENTLQIEYIQNVQNIVQSKGNKNNI